MLFGHPFRRHYYLGTSQPISEGWILDSDGNLRVTDPGNQEHPSWYAVQMVESHPGLHGAAHAINASTEPNPGVCVEGHLSGPTLPGRLGAPALERSIGRPGPRPVEGGAGAGQGTGFLPDFGDGRPMATPDPRAILMAGFDYQGGGADFGNLAVNRQKRLITASPRISVTLMNLGAGTTSVSAMTRNAKGALVRTVTTTSTHSPVTAGNYSSGLGHHARFDTDQAGRMSITDLYAAVQDVGSDQDTAGSLTEVSVFSHGFFQGPILVNSDDSSPSRSARDPDDKDARAGKDFRRPNMLDAELASFRAAWAASGLWWNWGSRVHFVVPPGHGAVHR